MPRTLFTARFWADAAERAVKTFAQAFAATLTAGAVTPASIPWTSGLFAAGVAAGVSLLTSIASVGQPDAISPASLVPPGL